MWKLKKWEDLPEYMKNAEVRRYYDMLAHRKVSIFFKRLFDIIVSFLMIIVLLPVFAVVAFAVVIDSPGGVFYLQERVTAYGRKFKIIKFRTMVANADRLGTQVTVNGDRRITRIGAVVRKYRLDEISQTVNVLKGDMTFVGTRPEVPRYVDSYTKEMMATLLLPAGVTSLASIMYKNEHKLLEKSMNVDDTYIRTVLPEKMKYNLESLTKFTFLNNIKVMCMTVAAVCGKEYIDYRVAASAELEETENVKQEESIV